MLYLFQMVLHGEIIYANDIPTFRRVVFAWHFCIQKLCRINKKNVFMYFKSLFIRPKKFRKSKITYFSLRSNFRGWTTLTTYFYYQRTLINSLRTNLKKTNKSKMIFCSNEKNNEAEMKQVISYNFSRNTQLVWSTEVLTIWRLFLSHWIPGDVQKKW